MPPYDGCGYEACPQKPKGKPWAHLQEPPRPPRLVNGRWFTGCNVAVDVTFNEHGYLHMKLSDCLNKDEVGELIEFLKDCQQQMLR